MPEGLTQCPNAMMTHHNHRNVQEMQLSESKSSDNCTCQQHSYSDTKPKHTVHCSNQKPSWHHSCARSAPNKNNPITRVYVFIWFILWSLLFLLRVERRDKFVLRLILRPKETLATQQGCLGVTMVAPRCFLGPNQLKSVWHQFF